MTLATQLNSINLEQTIDHPSNESRPTGGFLSILRSEELPVYNW